MQRVRWFTTICMNQHSTMAGNRQQRSQLNHNIIHAIQTHARTVHILHTNWNRNVQMQISHSFPVWISPTKAALIVFDSCVRSMIFCLYVVKRQMPNECHHCMYDYRNCSVPGSMHSAVYCLPFQFFLFLFFYIPFHWFLSHIFTLLTYIYLFIYYYLIGTK